MRGFYWRGIKYEVKMGNVKLGVVFSRNVERMASNWRRQTDPFYIAEAKLRGYLIDNEVKSILFPFYLSFGRKALMLYQNYSGEALTERINDLIRLFTGYGLNQTLLRNIIRDVFYLTPQPS
jgi:hypothetical protein